MNLGKLFPKANQNNNEDKFNNLLYVVLVEWKWSYEDFRKTPIPVLFRLLKKHKEKIDEQNKQSKKK